ncbi:hypothetical protein LTR09_001104 [Extremus antarcticus]|uniref:Cytochrome b561 domain-containing protein n=1 Tax=Extremus antarcticus TaxID=702011 RepID=A0AAJ0LWL2_9PEZI|nr:hypothetical protein LTR09_001104 [Extremus antarcticus]
MASNLSPPGSSQYSSNTMTVGDGTWDSSRNSFLLPNLVGLNFETMRYNGMGNRFKDLPGYHKLILGHGVLAAITFLGILPAAIFLAKYGGQWPGTRPSFKLHVYLQILVVFLSTVILVLGWFAVGPERSLTNPHHGIGVAIYVLIIYQFLYGSLMFRHERRRKSFPTKVPIGIWIHKLQGRAVAILAIVQVALGLTLYGSPKVLFILYALMVFLLVVAYLVLDYRHKTQNGGGGGGGHGGGQSEYSSNYGSYVSGSRVDQRPPRQKESHWGRKILAGAGAFGAYEWWKRRKDGRRDETYEESVDSRHDRRSSRPPPQGPPPMGQPPYEPPPMGRAAYGPPPVGQAPYGPPPMGQPPYGPPPVGQRGPIDPPPGGPLPMGPPPMNVAHAQETRQGSQSRVSGQSWEDEKYGERPRHTWRDRILGVTGAFAAYEGARSLFGRRRRREDDYSDDGRYTPPPRGAHNEVSRTDVTRVEAGQAPASPETPRVNMRGVQPMTPGMTPSRPPRQPEMNTELSYESQYDVTLRESVNEYGPIAGFREWNRSRRARKDAANADFMRRQQLEMEQDYNNRNSQNYPGPQDANQRRQSMSGTHLTGTEQNMQSDVRSNVRPDTSHPPLPPDAGTIPGSQYTESRHDVQTVQTQQGYSLPPPPPGPPPNVVRPDGYSPPQFGSARMPEGAVNPDPSRLLSENTTANQASAFGRDPSATNITAPAEMGSLSPTRPAGSRHTGSRNRLQKPGSVTSASASGVAGPSSGTGTEQPAATMKMSMENGGRKVTLRRLSEEEAAAERAARRQERRSRRRRGSSLSSGIEDDAPPGPRYRRNGPIRPSNDQPITNVPPPPPMSSSAGQSQRRESELNLPPAPPVPQHSISPGSHQGLSSPPVNESGFGSPGDAGTGTDVSAFADNRRRRRAERARQQAERGGGGNRVEFEY